MVGGKPPKSVAVDSVQPSETMPSRGRRKRRDGLQGALFGSALKCGRALLEHKESGRAVRFVENDGMRSNDMMYSPSCQQQSSNADCLPTPS